MALGFMSALLRQGASGKCIEVGRCRNTGQFLAGRRTIGCADQHPRTTDGHHKGTVV